LQHKVPDKLTDPTSVTQIHSITKHIGMLVNGMHGEPLAQHSSALAAWLASRVGAAAGCCFPKQASVVCRLHHSLDTHPTSLSPTRPPTCTPLSPPPTPLPSLLSFPAGDARSLVQKSRAEAAEFRFKYGYEMPVHYLSRVLADQAQVYTQVSESPLACKERSSCLKGVGSFSSSAMWKDCEGAAQLLVGMMQSRHMHSIANSHASDAPAGVCSLPCPPPCRLPRCGRWA
jgi:hypothetical protein